MPTEHIDNICEQFIGEADQKELIFWKEDVLYGVVTVIYYRFEQLLDCYPGRLDIIDGLLTRIRDVYEKFSDMKTSYQARMKLWRDTTHAGISTIAVNRVNWILGGCVGNYHNIEEDLNLKFIDLKSQRTVIRKLVGICLSYFEQQMAENISAQSTSEVAHVDALGDFSSKTHLFTKDEKLSRNDHDLTQHSQSALFFHDMRLKISSVNEERQAQPARKFRKATSEIRICSAK